MTLGIEPAPPRERKGGVWSRFANCFAAGFQFELCRAWSDRGGVEVGLFSPPALAFLLLLFLFLFPFPSIALFLQFTKLRLLSSYLIEKLIVLQHGLPRDIQRLPDRGSEALV